MSRSHAGIQISEINEGDVPMKSRYSMRSVRIALLAAGALVWASSTGAWAAGAGSLFVAGATSTPTHWNIQIGVPTVAEIQGVPTSEAGDPLPATIDVIIKSSDFGNVTVIGTRIGMTSNYSFTYTPPAIANGDEFDACNTTIVAYITNGNNSNNDLIDDGLQNGSTNASAGFRFVDANGDPIECVVLGVESTPWTGFKSLYR
jgi:hypothetical protein